MSARSTDVGTEAGGEGGPKRAATTLIRVSTGFADAVRKAASFERRSIGAFADDRLTPVVVKCFQDAVMTEAKRMESGR